MTADRQAFGLVGDIGGTHLRLALASSPAAGPVRLHGVEETGHGASVDLKAAVADYLERRAPQGVAFAALAVAGPVDKGVVSLTNARGALSEADLAQAVGGAPARLLNDFAALAMAAPVLGPDDLHTVGPERAAEPDATIAVLGPGTGLGVSALVRDGRGAAVAVTEGGHVGFAPTDEVEVEVWRRLTALYGRCSLERILCGPGLLALHAALGGRPFAEPAALVAAAEAGDAAAAATVERFCAILGSAAGDAALMFGAKGGVLIGGGIAAKLLARLQASAFRERFEAKGRFVGYLEAIPTAVIVNPHAALLGAARAFAP